jgi:hypothetical protein
MDFAIPTQLLEVGNVHMKPFVQKGHYPPLAVLQYTAPNITLKHFTLLTPPLVVEEWNAAKGRLRLNCDKHQFFKTKFLALQEYLIGTLFVHQQMLLGRSDLSHETIRSCFRTLFDKSILSCFISLYHHFPLFDNGQRISPENFGDALKSGREMRLILQLTGISQLSNHGSGGAPYSFRIQHQILGAYLLPSAGSVLCHSP